jgi:hypothetical protein
METVTAAGASGTKYTYTAHEHPVVWKDVAVNYMFASRGVAGWKVHYIGQCDSAHGRLTAHERWDEAKKLGATHVLAHANNGGDEARKKEERDLILSHNPPLNTHHRPDQKSTGTRG